MRLLVRSVVLGSFLFSASQAFSLEPDFQIQQGVLGYSSATLESKPDGGQTSTDKETSMTTMDNSLRLSATTETMAFYVYPTQEGIPFGVGYYVMPELEVGLNISLMSKDFDEDSDGNTGDFDYTENSYGPYVRYYLNNVGPLSMEFDFALTMTSGKASKEGTDLVDRTGMDIFLGASAFYPIAKNLHYGFGLAYTKSSLKDDVATAGDVLGGDYLVEGTAKGEEANSTLDLNLATLRFNF